jgi:hypothetical protein
VTPYFGFDVRRWYSAQETPTSSGESGNALSWASWHDGHPA